MSCEWVVILEDSGEACPLPAAMDVKNEELILGQNLPGAIMLLEDIASELKIPSLTKFMKEEYDEDMEEIGFP